MLEDSLTTSDYKKYLKANRSNVLLWSSLVVFILFVYHFFSDGDFSFLLVDILACNDDVDTGKSR